MCITMFDNVLMQLTSDRFFTVSRISERPSTPPKSPSMCSIDVTTKLVASRKLSEAINESNFSGISLKATLENNGSWRKRSTLFLKCQNYVHSLHELEDVLVLNTVEPMLLKM